MSDQFPIKVMSITDFTGNIFIIMSNQVLPMVPTSYEDTGVRTSVGFFFRVSPYMRFNTETAAL